MARTDPIAASELAELFRGWKSEHRQLDKQMLELFQWMNAASLREDPPFARAAERLRELLMMLQLHFRHEDTLGEKLATSHPNSTVEIDAVRTRPAQEHQTLHDRLEQIIARLDSRSDDDKELWATVVYEFNLFFDLLEQHEELEESSVSWLRPPADQADEPPSSESNE